ncbi:MAG: hypothetical protein A2902_02300 [Elusimicrobia bacterium RIFCSPLOWO2_01_FULL_64_13]|nr:MAG: hypothetical protein A2636_07175 [Elusimicrobia bacterium RIFCSPHIGHO2_01_FULL_64_10]OGR94379.1 MAG: hypothetical protein A2902_02300 [Elusimicrobia bacterium RIFCSPLOWO2_01_FULL_64_13]
MTRSQPVHPPVEERILFLYVFPKGGHKECADAVRSALGALPGRGVITAGIDAITSLYPILGPLIAKTYLELIRYTPQIWDFLYDNPDVEELTREIRQLFNLFNAPKLKSLIAEFRPSAFVCTHAIPCGVIAEQKKRGNCRLPLIGVVTDYDVHRYWAYPEVDLYIVANEESKRTLVSRGVQEERVQVRGIPVDPSFARRTDRRTAREKLGFDPDRPLVLLMGGSRGLGPIAETVAGILSLRPAPQIAVAAGTNESLERELRQWGEDRVRVWGHTGAIAELMDAADFTITKPGGITTTECLAKGLPIVILNPIPGQEERNARILIKNGLAIAAKDTGEAVSITGILLNDPEKLSGLSRRALAGSNPRSAESAARAILELLEQPGRRSESNRDAPDSWPGNGSSETPSPGLTLHA